ncbi:hypothetical protein [Spirosoma harenae]
MTYSIDAYRCSHCGEIVFHLSVTSFYHRGGVVDIYSDGYTRSMGSLRFVQCPLCECFQRSEDLIPLNKSSYDYRSEYPDFPEEEQDDLGRRNPRDVYGLGFEEYCQLIRTRPFPLTAEEELFIRNRIRWWSNRFFREYDKEGGITYRLRSRKYVTRRIRLPKRCEIGNAFWRENLERIVELNPGVTVNERLSKADALRSLGDFQGSLAILRLLEESMDQAGEIDPTDMPRRACKDLIHACKRKNRRPFVIRAPNYRVIYW